MVAHVLMEEIQTTFLIEGTKNVAKVIENRRKNDPNGQWPDTALGIVAQSNPDGTKFAFIGWKEPSSRGHTEFSKWHWDQACSVARDLVNETQIEGSEPKVASCRWYHSCRTDLDPPWVAVDQNYAYSMTKDYAGTVYFYEQPFKTENNMNCKKEIH
jgi:hypothetical protein